MLLVAALIASTPVDKDFVSSGSCVAATPPIQTLPAIIWTIGLGTTPINNDQQKILEDAVDWWNASFPVGAVMLDPAESEAYDQDGHEIFINDDSPSVFPTVIYDWDHETGCLIRRVYLYMPEAATPNAFAYVVWALGASIGLETDINFPTSVMSLGTTTNSGIINGSIILLPADYERLENAIIL